MGNPFIHVELSTNDVAKAKGFYGALFDWKIEDMDMGGGVNYGMIGVGEGTGGGIVAQMRPGAPSAWMPYVIVADIVASTAKAKSLGATIVQDVMEVMGMGRLSVMIDPTGAAIGLWQPNPR